MIDTATSYDAAPHWRAYQPFFPVRARFTTDNRPQEEMWRWGDALVHLDRQDVAGAPVKVMLLHGAGGNGRLAAPFGVILRAHGIASVSPDLPGYGISRAPKRDVDNARWIDLVVDLIAAEHARDDLPIVLFGVSLGGMIAYQAACRSPHVRGVIATTFVDPGHGPTRDQMARNRVLARVGGWLLRALRPITDGISIPIRWVSRMGTIANQPEIVRLLLRDPTTAGAWVPLRFLRSLLEMRPLIAPEAFDRCPVLLVHPALDRMTPLPLSEHFFARLAAPKRMVVLEGCGHMPLESPGIEQLEEAVLGFIREYSRSP